jgi:hypothetical protein
MPSLSVPIDTSRYSGSYRNYSVDYLVFFVLHITKREFCPLGHVHEWILIAGYMLRIQIEFVED